MRETFGRYRALERIGSGRLGALYRARDTRTGRTVALRIVADSIVEDVPRLTSLLRSARAAAAISHPTIAALYEVGEDDGVRYLACEFVDGRTIGALSAGNPLSPRRVLEIGIELADALAEAHAHEQSHGGISVDTVMITTRGRAKLIDFGLSEDINVDSFDESADLAGLRSVLEKIAPPESMGVASSSAVLLAAGLRARLDTLDRR